MHFHFKKNKSPLARKGSVLIEASLTISLIFGIFILIFNFLLKTLPIGNQIQETNEVIIDERID